MEMKDKAMMNVPNKTTAVVYLLIGFLVAVVGIIAHMMQTAAFNISSSETIFQQLDILFVENFFIGFFTAVFIILGIVYYKAGAKADD